MFGNREGDMSENRPAASLEEAYLTVGEVAACLKISRWKVYELIRLRELDSFLIGRCRRVPGRAVAAMVDRLMKDVA
jgi:excisionase family DNA binding protein